MEFLPEGKDPILCKAKHCFAFVSERHCKILKETALGKDGICVFYKTKEEFEEGLRKYGGPKE